MSTPITQPVPANEPVTIAPVKKLTIWQRLERWLKTQGNRIILVAGWLVSLKLAYELGQWAQ